MTDDNKHKYIKIHQQQNSYHVDYMLILKKAKEERSPFLIPLISSTCTIYLTDSMRLLKDAKSNVTLCHGMTVCLKPSRCNRLLKCKQRQPNKAHWNLTSSLSTFWFCLDEQWLHKEKIIVASKRWTIVFLSFIEDFCAFITKNDLLLINPFDFASMNIKYKLNQMFKRSIHQELVNEWKTNFRVDTCHWTSKRYENMCFTKRNITRMRKICTEIMKKNRLSNVLVTCFQAFLSYNLKWRVSSILILFI